MTGILTYFVKSNCSGVVECLVSNIAVRARVTAGVFFYYLFSAMAVIHCERNMSSHVRFRSYHVFLAGPSELHNIRNGQHILGLGNEKNVHASRGRLPRCTQASNISNSRTYNQINCYIFYSLEAECRRLDCTSWPCKDLVVILQYAKTWGARPRG